MTRTMIQNQLTDIRRQAAADEKGARIYIDTLAVLRDAEGRKLMEEECQCSLCTADEIKID